MIFADRWIGGFFFLFGLSVVIEALRLDYGGGYGAGPGFFPFWLGVTVTLLGVLLVAQAFRAPLEVCEGSVPSIGRKKRGLAYAALIAFVPAIELLGFVTAFTLLVAFLLLAIEGENWRTATLTALASGIGFDLFFVRLLKVDLPLGPLGF